MGLCAGTALARGGFGVPAPAGPVMPVHVRQLCEPSIGRPSQKGVTRLWKPGRPCRRGWPISAAQQAGLAGVQPFGFLLLDECFPAQQTHGPFLMKFPLKIWELGSCFSTQMPDL